MSKLIYAVIIIFSGLSVKANPLEVAQNVFQEYRQVMELIKQAEELIKQAENQAEIIKNLSGKNLYEMTSQEIELLRWLPQGEELLNPEGNSEYAINFEQIDQQLGLSDNFEDFGIIEGDTTAQMAPQAMSRNRHQKTTIANSAYANTFMNQFTRRVDVVTGYLDELNNADTLKKSVDVSARITAQAAINQIEINRTMAMILQQKASQVQVDLTNEQYIRSFFKGSTE